MLFNSFDFIFIFFPLVLYISLRLRGTDLLCWLTLSSYVFYSLFGQAWFLLPMLFTTVLDFFLAQAIDGLAPTPKKRALLGISLFGNLGLLIYFKYAGLFFSHWFPIKFAQLILPAGISFYTFQTLSYILDVYKGSAKAERNFWKFASFVSFFPHLVAGPLTRHHQLLPGLEKIRQEGAKPRWPEGIFLFVIGLIKKTLVADPIAHVINPILLKGNFGGSEAWLCLLGFSLQIYFDFSAYSDMAIGLARLFGIELPQNFNSPYQARSPSDFWRRWHITLSTWLRDYLYIPLLGQGDSFKRKAIALVVTMALGGLWHGANWTFMLWGLYHGGLLVLYHRSRRVWDTWPTAIQRALTYSGVTLGWVLFRSSSLEMARHWARELLDGSGFVPQAMTAQFVGGTGLVVVALVLAMGFPNASSKTNWDQLSSPGQIFLGGLAVVALLCMNYSSAFIYFQF